MEDKDGKLRSDFNCNKPSKYNPTSTVIKEET